MELRVQSSFGVRLAAGEHLINGQVKSACAAQQPLYERSSRFEACPD
jgi:hypothetical protein